MEERYFIYLLKYILVMASQLTVIDKDNTFIRENTEQPLDEIVTKSNMNFPKLDSKVDIEKGDDEPLKSHDIDISTPRKPADVNKVQPVQITENSKQGIKI